MTSSSVIIGNSPSVQDLRALIAQVASTELPVLIHGPTGSGKELVAQSLHHTSGRRGRCIALNVCALSESMFEAALFGHVRGAFTGALRDSQGMLQEADGGTLFLDEISGLPLGAQAKLLRAVETREFRPVGGHADRHSTFRVVSATNERLDELVQRGQFRADLMHRLSGIVVELRPLTERLEDIPALVAHFIETSEFRSRLVSVSSSGLRALEEHSWPGNIRELRHVIERSAALASTSVLGRAEITRALHHGRTSSASLHNAVERKKLMEVMKRNRWDTAAAAATLGVHRGTVYRWLHRFGIALPQNRATLVEEME